MPDLRAVKGMNDVLPDEARRFQRVEAAFREAAGRAGYAEVRTPLVEPTELFVRSIGEATDIVGKEMYTFVDKGEDRLTIRPEGTASAVRAYVEHSVHAKEPITKWWYVGSMFRRERPARGRLRQFTQAGLECFGDPGPHVDAEMIDLVVSLLESLGVLDVEVLVNSLGDVAARERFREALVTHLSPHREKLSEESQRRLTTNPLRILDSKSPGDQELCASAPTIADFLSEGDRAHFESLKKTLDALGTKYRVEPKLVRGLDYYSRTLFEIQGRRASEGGGGELGAQNALCGGGRYDGLVESIGGPALPSIGFAMGIERILLALPAEDATHAIDVAVLCADEALRDDACVLLRDLRRAGMSADADLRGQSVKSQMRRADRLGARVLLFVGADEAARGVVALKNMRARTQSDVARADVVAAALKIAQEPA